MNEDEKDFLSMISKEFTINDLFNEYGAGNYSNRPNVPGQWEKKMPNPFEQKKSPYQIYPNYPSIPPYQIGDVPEQDPFERDKKDLDDALSEALRIFIREREQREREAAQRALTVQDEIQRIFGNTSTLKAEEKKEILKSAFIKMIADKINFDDNGSLLDEHGNIVKSIGQFGLMFMRILNAVLESKRTAEQNEKDLKSLK